MELKKLFVIFHRKSKKYIIGSFIFAFMVFNLFNFASAQTQIMPWGNIKGIRVEGDIIKFNTNFQLVKSDWEEVLKTAKESQDPGFERDNSTANIETNLDDLSISEKVKDKGSGQASIEIEFIADSNISMQGAYFTLELPKEDFSKPSFSFINKKSEEKLDKENLPRRMRSADLNKVVAQGMKIESPDHKMEINISEDTEIIINKADPSWGTPNPKVYFTLMQGNVKSGQKVNRKFDIKVSGEIDKRPIQLTMDADDPGRVYKGVGGNFRLQGPNDPKVIDYNLENLDVNYGRVEMPWARWHPEEDMDPLKAARNGKLDQKVEAAMEMAQRLAKQDMPVIVSAWQVPEWAAIGERKFGPGPDGKYGNALKQEKMRSIIKSITSYLVYLKEEYGVEAKMFSFNESDLGIYVRQTGEEHARLIKQLGSHMASKGLSTKMLLGDNSDATTYDFLEPAINDPETHKYIGAMSFHSWRGFDNWTLSIWGDISKQLNVPLLVGEGSINAAAWHYPDVFLEPRYALKEIDIYVRILSICQAKSILQWQLTADYSVLTGGGVFGTEGELRPTQRFWNLKQLGLTPEGSFHLPIESNRSNVSCVAFGDIKNDKYTVHLVNKGAKRKVTLEGLPKDIDKMQMYITDSERGMKETETIRVEDGVAKFSLDAAGFTSLVSID